MNLIWTLQQLHEDLANVSSDCKEAMVWRWSIAVLGGACTGDTALHAQHCSVRQACCWSR